MFVIFLIKARQMCFSTRTVFLKQNKQQSAAFTQSLQVNPSRGFWVLPIFFFLRDSKHELKKVKDLSNSTQEHMVKILCSLYFFKVLFVKNLFSRHLQTAYWHICQVHLELWNKLWITWGKVHLYTHITCNNFKKIFYL